MNRGNHVANLYRFVIAVWRAKERNAGRVKYWEIIANKLSKAGWSWGCGRGGSNGRTIWIADAHRDDVVQPRLCPETLLRQFRRT
jgi:hypothetical protein